MSIACSQTEISAAAWICACPTRTAKRYADRYALIVVEDLNVRALARSRLAKSILDASWRAFLTILSCKAASAGGQVIRINPRYTTHKCSKCGELVQKSLSVRTHICPSCGYVAGRDVNAAQNILYPFRMINHALLRRAAPGTLWVWVPGRAPQQKKKFGGGRYPVPPPNPHQRASFLANLVLQAGAPPSGTVADRLPVEPRSRRL